MAKINWEMMTQFIFSKEYGIVEEVVSVQVIPVGNRKRRKIPFV